MFTKLEEALLKYEQIGEQLADPDIVSNQKEYLRCMREHKAMTPLIEKYKEYSSNLPNDFTQEIIEGANHAGFGMYGKQKGDGSAEISNEEQIEITAEIIKKFSHELS